MPWLGTQAARDIWWFFLVVLVGQTALSGINLYRSAANENEVAHTLQVLNALNQVLANVIDTETGARGFVITGDDQFLEPYERSQPELTPRINQIAELTKDNPVQHEHIAQLNALNERRQRQLAGVIAERRKPQPDQEMIAWQVVEGKTVMDTIRQRIDKMKAVENELLDARRIVSKGTFYTALYATVLGGLLSIGMLGLTRFLIRKENDVRRKGEESLRISEERFSLLAETLPHLAWVADATGGMEYFNPIFSAYTGRPAAEALGHAWLDSVHADDRGRTEDAWKQAISTGQLFELEHRLRRHDGAHRWFLVRALPQRDGKGQINHWYGASVDINDQKRTEELLEERVRERTEKLRTALDELHEEAGRREQVTEKLRVTAGELSRSNHELEQFAYVASHDLQEPLRKIQAFGDRLSTRYGESIEGQGKEYIERMQNAAKRMRRLIDDLLSFSRVSTQPRRSSPVNLREVALDVVNDLEVAIAQSGGRVDVGDLPSIDADASQIRHLFQNLIGNALKFHKPDQPSIVKVEADMLNRMPDDHPDLPDRPAVCVRFIDNGIGFDMTYADRIFQVFQRLHGREQYEGTGIGLAVVKKIVERHDGTIRVKSEPGNGTTFAIYLPRHAPESGNSISEVHLTENLNTLT